MITQQLSDCSSFLPYLLNDSAVEGKSYAIQYLYAFICGWTQFDRLWIVVIDHWGGINLKLTIAKNNIIIILWHNIRYFNHKISIVAMATWSFFF